MKLRSGFVSNSSSSSYVLITTQETYDKVMAQLSELEQGAVKAEFRFSKKKVFGEDKLVCMETISIEELGCEWDFLPESEDTYDSKEWHEAYDGMDKFYGLLEKEDDSFTMQE